MSQLFFQEKLQKRCSAFENMLKNEDIRPGAVIADDEIGGMRIQVDRSFNIPLRMGHDPRNETVALHPPRSKGYQDQRTPVSQSRREGNQSQQDGGTEKGNPKYRIQCDQQKGRSAMNRKSYTFQHA